MLQTYRSPGQLGDVSSQHDVSYPAVPSLAEQFGWIVGFIRRRLFIALSVVPLTLGLAAVYLFTTPPLYQGQAKIIIDTGKVQIFQQSILGEDPQNAAMIDSQIEILKSGNFALSIIKKLGLTLDPEFVNSNEGLISSVRRLLLYPFTKDEPKSESEIAQHVMGVFENRLTANRVGTTYVIEIGFLSTNPDRAAQIANAVADAFIADLLEAKYQTLQRAMGWMQDRLNELRGQVSAADRAVIDYKSENKIVETNGHLINDQQLTDLNTALIKLRADTQETKARLDRVLQILSSNNLDLADTEIATVADSLRNAIITGLRQQYLGLAQREAIFSARYGHNHLAVVNLRNQMAEIRHSIVDELKQIAEAYKSDFDIAKAREHSLEQSLAATVEGSQTTSKAQIELLQLQSAAQTYHALYDNLQKRYTETVQQQSLPMNETRVITRASHPYSKTYPKTVRTLAVATMGGLLLGLGLALVREISERVFRTAGQVETELKTECLALVPLIKPGTKVPSVDIKALSDNATSEITPRRVIPQKGGLLRHVINSPLSRFSESIRAVKVSADLASLAKSNRVIGITSSLPNEGKSTIAASLAQLCATGGARVVLVDCDLRQPSLSQELVPDASEGIIEVLAGTVSLEQAIWTDPLTKLSFLPVARKQRLTHTSEILASDAAKQLFQRLRNSYDYVIVDLSPLAPVVDVRSTAQFIDFYVFVVEWGETKIDVVQHALTAARGVYENLLGIVLNKVDIQRLIRYDGHRGDYYYNRHYGRYGYTD
jgi:polysaccharide biosynthesis transport protein